MSQLALSAGDSRMYADPRAIDGQHFAVVHAGALQLKLARPAGPAWHSSFLLSVEQPEGKTALPSAIGASAHPQIHYCPDGASGDEALDAQQTIGECR